MSCRPKSCQTYVIFMHYVISSCNSTSYCDFRIRKNICCSLRIQLCSFLYCMQLFFIMCDTFTLLISVLHFSLQRSHFVFSFISCHVVRSPIRRIVLPYCDFSIRKKTLVSEKKIHPCVVLYEYNCVLFCTVCNCSS